MKVVTDAASNLSPERAAALGVSVIPFRVTFMGNTYRDGVDILPGDLYKMYTEYPNEFAETSQPSVGDFTTAYEAAEDDEILSVHLSSGLSGTCSSAEHAAQMIPGKKVTVINSMTVGPALGWMVEMAAYGVSKGWSKDQVLAAMKKVQENTITMVGFSDMKHLIHSGRVSHLKSIFASMLRIKPIIGMNPVDGRYITLGQDMTVNRSIARMIEIVRKRYGEQKLRMQLMHGDNLAGVTALGEAMKGILNIVEEKLVPVTLVLGAHAGPTVIGLAAAPQSIFDELYGQA